MGRWPGPVQPSFRRHRLQRQDNTPSYISKPLDSSTALRFPSISIYTLPFSIFPDQRGPASLIPSTPHSHKGCCFALSSRRPPANGQHILRAPNKPGLRLHACIALRIKQSKWLPNLTQTTTPRRRAILCTHNVPRHSRFCDCRLTDSLRDASGAERKEEDDTATAILKKKKKPNQLMYDLLLRFCLVKGNSDTTQGH